MTELHAREIVKLDEVGRVILDRFRVAGGWIYCVYNEPGGYTTGAVFVPDVPEGALAEHHVCGHGYAARTCGLCERDGMLR